GLTRERLGLVKLPIGSRKFCLNRTPLELSCHIVWRRSLAADGCETLRFIEPALGVKDLGEHSRDAGHVSLVAERGQRGKILAQLILRPREVAGEHLHRG